MVGRAEWGVTRRDGSGADRHHRSRAWRDYGQTNLRRAPLRCRWPRDDDVLGSLPALAGGVTCGRAAVPAGSRTQRATSGAVTACGPVPRLGSSPPRRLQPRRPTNSPRRRASWTTWVNGRSGDSSKNLRSPAPRPGCHAPEAGSRRAAAALSFTAPSRPARSTSAPSSLRPSSQCSFPEGHFPWPTRP